MTVTVFPVDAPSYELPCEGELGLREAQKLVGGYVECVYSRDFELDADGDERPTSIMILNEEGKLEGLALNVVATALAHGLGMLDPADCIVGQAIVLTGGNRWT
jgi:hypothetical protein